MVLITISSPLHRRTKYPNLTSKTLPLFYPIATVCAGTESTYLIQTKIQFAKKLSSRCRGRLCRSCVVGVLRRIIYKNFDQHKFNYTTIEILSITKLKCSFPQSVARVGLCHRFQDFAADIIPGTDNVVLLRIDFSAN